MVYLGSAPMCDFTHPLEPMDIYSIEKGNLRVEKADIGVTLPYKTET